MLVFSVLSLLNFTILTISLSPGRPFWRQTLANSILRVRVGRGWRNLSAPGRPSWPERSGCALSCCGSWALPSSNPRVCSNGGNHTHEQWRLLRKRFDDCGALQRGAVTFLVCDLRILHDVLGVALLFFHYRRSHCNMQYGRGE